MGIYLCRRFRAKGGQGRSLEQSCRFNCVCIMNLIAMHIIRLVFDEGEWVNEKTCKLITRSSAVGVGERKQHGSYKNGEVRETRDDDMDYGMTMR